MLDSKNLPVTDSETIIDNIGNELNRFKILSRKCIRSIN